MASAGFMEERSLRRIRSVQVVRRQEQILLAGARLLDVDGRVDAPVGHLAVEHDLHVARTLELLEDDLVHAAAGVNQRGGQDGQAAALLEVARRAEEPFRPVQGVGLDTAQRILPEAGVTVL